MNRLIHFCLAPTVLRMVFWLLAAFTLMMALLPKPPHLPIDRFGDKFEHMLAFFVLTLVADLAWRDVARSAIVFRLALFGAAIEVLQLIPVLGRDSDYRDWIADVIAVLVATLFARAAIRWLPWLSPAQ